MIVICKGCGYEFESTTEEFKRHFCRGMRKKELEEK